MTWRVHVRPVPWMDDFELWVGRYDGRGGIAVITGFQTTQIEEGGYSEPIPREAGFSHRDLLQAIVTAAWEAGIRPAGYGDVRESITATKAHLDDMRKLAFKAHGIDK